MYTHPFFDLILHDDEELAELLGSPLDRRQTLQEWPLSCVQKLTLADGRHWVYKSCHLPTVEAEFYARARSPLLVSVQQIYRQGDYVCLLIPWIDAPRLADLSLSPQEALATGHSLLAQIAAIQGELPYFLELRSLEQWAELSNQILEALSRLLGAGKLCEVNAHALNSLQHVLWQKPILELLEQDAGLVHQDLGGENIFLCADGWRVIDWQRPVFAPRSLDWVSLLESCGMDPALFLPKEVLFLKRILDIHWFVQCAERWFPAGLSTYDHQIAQCIAQLEAGY